MKVEILFFGELAEITETKSLLIEDVDDLGILKELLIFKFPLLIFKPIQVAVNNNLQIENISLNDGDVIALLPPFAGG